MICGKWTVEYNRMIPKLSKGDSSRSWLLQMIWTSSDTSLQNKLIMIFDRIPNLGSRNWSDSQFRVIPDPKTMITIDNVRTNRIFLWPYLCDPKVGTRFISWIPCSLLLPRCRKHSYLTKHCVFESNKIIFCSFMDSASSSTIFWAELTHKPRKYDQFLLILADDLSWSTKNFGELATETHIMYSPELYIVVWSRDTVFF